MNRLNLYKILLTCLMVGSVFSISLIAQESSPQELFIKGNIAYGNGSFAEAEEAYREVLRSGHSAEVHYNLGNTLAQQNQWSEAAFHYMKAYSLKPGFDPARANLLLAAERMGLSEDYPELSFPAKFLSEAKWTAAAAIAFWLALIFFFYRDFVKFRIPFGRTLGVLSLVGLAFSIVAIVQHQLFRDWAVVSSPLVSLRVAPTDQSPGESVLIKGDPIRVLGEQKGFFHVMTASGDEGFILLNEVHRPSND